MKRRLLGIGTYGPLFLLAGMQTENIYAVGGCLLLTGICGIIYKREYGEGHEAR